MSEEIKEIKVTKKPGFAIKFDGEYSSIYKIINKYVSIFGKYFASFSIDFESQGFDTNRNLQYKLILSAHSKHEKKGFILNEDEWIVFFGADVRTYTDNDFKATFDSEDRND